MRTMHVITTCLAIVAIAGCARTSDDAPAISSHIDIMTNTVTMLSRGPSTSVATTQTLTLAEVTTLDKWEDQRVGSLFRSLIAGGYVTNGTPLRQAVSILGEPTSSKPNYVQWYFNARWHVFPCLSATLTNGCLQNVTINTK